MDIDLLSKMVKELILDNDKVTLPGLGSFVAEVVPSTFSDKGYTINPPYRRLSFRSKVSDGDELVACYATANNVEKAVAERILVDFLKELKAVLFVKKTVVFPGLGRMRATKENTIFFIADEDLDIYPDGFALEPISLKAHQYAQTDVSDVMVGLKSIITGQPEETEPVIEVESIPSPEVEQEPEVESSPDIEQAPDAEQDEEQYHAGERKRSPWKVVLIVLMCIFVLSLLLFVAFFVVSRLQPELLDPILYSAEELEILYYKL